MAISNLECGQVKMLRWIEGSGKDPRTLFEMKVLEMKVLEMNVGCRILN